MTKREFLKLPIWSRIPDGAEIIGTIFSKVVHKNDDGTPKKIVVDGDLVTDQNIDLIFSSNRVGHECKSDIR